MAESIKQQEQQRMDHGRVAEEGTPTELLARKGMYYEMYKSQRV